MTGGKRLLFPAAALGLHLAAATHPDVVEAWYSRAIFPRVAASIALLTKSLPFAAAEPLLIGALLALGALGVRRLRLLRGPWRARLSEAGARLAAVAGLVYLLFLLLWGLNYQRLTFARSSGLDVRPSTARELADVACILTARADALRVGLPEDTAGVLRLTAGARDALARTPLGFAAARDRFTFLGTTGARPKPAFLSPLLSLLAISGIYSPFTAEPLVNAEVPDPDLPFCAAHEMAHAVGFAREDEANYLGSLACRLHPDADFRYSGTLAASASALEALARVDRDEARRLHDARSAAVKRDLEALTAWALRHEGPVAEASRRVNDAYLRSQGTRDGLASYGRFVDLLIAEHRAEGRLPRSGGRPMDRANLRP